MSATRRCLPLLAALLAAAPLQAGTLKVPSTQFASIQSAVDAAASGDVILVSKGVYREQVTVGTSGIALHGKSGAVIDAVYAGNCLLVQADDVQISGFTLANGGLGQALPLADGPGTAGGLHYVGVGADLSKLSIHAPQDFGILLEGTGSIDKCSVDGSFGYGLRVVTGSSLSSTVTSITRCDTHRCVTGIDAEDGPFVISKNVCELNQSIGIDVEIPPIVQDGSATPVPTVVSGNSASGSYVYGMLVSDALGAGMSVEKNTCTGSSFGLLVAGFNVEVMSNTVQDNFTGGLFLMATGCHVAKNKVRGNASVGISVGSATALDGGNDGSNHVEQNTVQENGGDGIHVASDNNLIHENVVKQNLGDGIQTEANGVTGNELMGNTVSDNEHDGLDNWALLTLIQDNVSKGNGGADLAGIGKGQGTTANGSGNNTTGDGTGLLSEQELDVSN
jgi:parallel beta-helix repeat protein